MNAQGITKALRGRWFGSFGMARCPAHDDRNPSQKISDSPDDGEITTHCFAGCDWRDVKDALRGQGLLPEWEPGRKGRQSGGGKLPQAVAGETRDKAREHHQHHHVEHEADERRRIEAARDLWARAQPIAGTIAHLYLQKRKITIAPPASLRYISSLKHKPTGLRLPALIAAVQAPDREITGIVRTYLRADGHGKAQVSTPRMALGRIGTGAVRLAAAASTLGLAEGIESALSAMQATGAPTWAAVGSRLESVELPEMVEHVIIFGDRDEPGRVAARKAEAVFRRQGRKVTIRFPGRGEDWNGALAGVAR